MLDFDFMELSSFKRHRRLRGNPALRGLIRETELTPRHLVYPLFVEAGLKGRQPIGSMPGQDRLGLAALAADARGLGSLQVPAVLLFGLPASKDERGSGAYAPDGIVQTAIRTMKDANPELLVVGDVCLCEYTSHGHCGLLRPDGSVDNDASLPLLAETAVSLVEAGCDIIAPSDMMDGRVSAIRQALDVARFPETPILSYAAKFASAFYARSVRPQTARHSSVIAAATRWTRRTAAWPSMKCSPTSTKGRTWSWSSQPALPGCGGKRARRRRCPRCRLQRQR